MAELILIRGVPGSGKSTWGRKHFPAHIQLEADMYFVRNGIYSWDAEHIGRAHEWCLITTRVLLDQGFDVVVSNTFVKESEINRYRNMVRDDLSHRSIDIRSYHIMTFYGSVHNVPDATIERMRQNFWYNKDDIHVE